MDSLSTPCVFCGIDRPLESEICPSCGRGWIDSRIADVAPPAATATTPVADSAGDDASPPPDREARASAPPPPPPLETPPTADTPDPETPIAGGGPPVAAAAAFSGAAFSDDSDTGADVDGGIGLPPLDDTSAGDAAVDPAAPQPDDAAPAESEQPDAETAAPPAKEPPFESTTTAPLDDATSMFTAPVTPAETAPEESVAPPPAPPLDEAPAAEPEPAIDLEPATPDDLGIIPVVTPTGPPAYVPEPDDLAPPTAATPPATEPAMPAPPDEELEPPAGPVDGSPTEPEPAGEQEPVAEDDPDTVDLPSFVTAPPPQAPEPDPLDEIPMVEPAEESDRDAAGAVAAVAAIGAEPDPHPIDPDALIGDVFSDDLVDGRPPTASDEMLDDDSAWSEFATGTATGAAAAAVTPPQSHEPPTTPDTAPPQVAPQEQPAVGQFGGQHPDDSEFFAATAAAAGAGATTATMGSGEPPRRGRRWSQTAVVGLIVLGIVGAWFVVLALITRDSGDDTAIATPDDTTATTAPSTTEGSDTTATTSSTTSSTTTTTAVPVIEPIGDPIPIEELGLGAFALGPIDFGATDALGRLVASLDQPDSITDANQEQGLCPDDSGFTADWGQFSAIFIGAPETNVFVGYRLGDDPSHPTSGMATLSGLEVGDSVATLESTYDGFDVSYREVDGQLSFILVRQSDGVTLLWGPVTSSEPDGVVNGIYSPQPCDGGPTASG